MHANDEDGEIRGFKCGKCRLSITMPVSSVQPIEFVKKSGMQYENLKGDFIVRDGISPSGKYEQEVIL